MTLLSYIYILLLVTSPVFLINAEEEHEGEDIAPPDDESLIKISLKNQAGLKISYPNGEIELPERKNVHIKTVDVYEAHGVLRPEGETTADKNRNNGREVPHSYPKPPNYNEYPLLPYQAYADQPLKNDGYFIPYFMAPIQTQGFSKNLKNREVKETTTEPPEVPADRISLQEFILIILTNAVTMIVNFIATNYLGALNNLFEIGKGCVQYFIGK